MNACTGTAPDIRVAGPAQDFFVRTFALFRVTGATGRRSAERTGAAGVNTAVLRATSEKGKGPFILGAPTVNPVPVSVHAALPAHDAKTRSTTLEFHVSAAWHLATNLSLYQRNDSCAKSFIGKRLNAM